MWWPFSKKNKKPKEPEADREADRPESPAQRLQRETREAMFKAGGETFCLFQGQNTKPGKLPTRHVRTSSGELIEIEVHEMDDEEIMQHLGKGLLHHGPNDLSRVPEHLRDDPVKVILYRHCLKTMPESDRQKIYEDGGIPAVRRMAVRLAEDMLAERHDEALQLVREKLS